MAQQIQDRITVVRGAPVVQPTNEFFWFNRPQWILFLIHFTLFQNAFQMAFFLFTVYEFWHKTCFHEKLVSVIARVVLGVALHILCNYITFPLYALVTQMGSHVKKSIFEEQTAKALKNWHRTAKVKQKKLRKAGAATDASSENTPSRGSSALHLLHKYQSNAMDQSESIPNTPLSYQSDIDLSDLEASNHDSRRSDHQDREEDSHGDGFSFVKP